MCACCVLVYDCNVCNVYVRYLMYPAYLTQSFKVIMYSNVTQCNVCMCPNCLMCFIYPMHLLHQSVSQSVCVSVCLCIHLSIYLLIDRSIFLSIYLFIIIYLSIYVYFIMCKYIYTYTVYNVIIYHVYNV